MILRLFASRVLQLWLVSLLHRRDFACVGLGAGYEETRLSLGFTGQQTLATSRQRTSALKHKVSSSFNPLHCPKNFFHVEWQFCNARISF
jgi:hypothetical protein